ncbi:MAG: FAD-dependent thymidylate synthase [Tepidanaerobacteraceae bacterium]|jgi:thymidylate synthase (FAD)|nr:FAD-dependent thymidylate synthase [Tepidanaerobacteraceae bacterium]
MKVSVLSHTPEPEKTVAAAARLCYSNISASEIMENFTGEKAALFIKKLMDMGHMSPVEHVSFTFAIDGVSRALLAQLTRHRIASYSVQSLRYNNPFREEMAHSSDDEVKKARHKAYKEGFDLASKLCGRQHPCQNELFDKDSIAGYISEKILKDFFPQYLRGIFEGGGILENGPILAISFPESLGAVLNKSPFNFTLEGNKLLMKKEDALNFCLYIYGELDFASRDYSGETLAALCRKSPEFFEAFVKAAENHIDSCCYSTLPESIAKSPEAILTYISGLECCKNSYIELVKMGVEQEDARYILPMGTQTRLVMTMNVRSLYNFFHQRCCRRAQSEIRHLAEMMLAEVKKIAPGLFEKAGAPCETEGFCPEGSFGCGRHPAKRPKV